MTKKIQFKKYLKYIFLGLIIITFMFSFPSVIAEGNDDNDSGSTETGNGDDNGEIDISDEVLELCETKVDIEQLKTRFGITFRYIDNDNFVIKVNPESKTADPNAIKILRNTKFKVVRINNDTTNSPYIGSEVSYGHDLQLHLTETIPSRGLQDRNGNLIDVVRDQAIYVELESEDIVDDSLLSEIFKKYPSAHDVKCDARIYVYLAYGTDGQPHYESSVRDLSSTDCSRSDLDALETAYCKTAGIGADPITCKSDAEDKARYGEGTIAYNFCQIKRLALASGNNQNGNYPRDYSDRIGANGKFDKSKTLPVFKCDPEHIRGFSENLEKPEDYYTERDYFYAKKSATYPTSTNADDAIYYEYEFSPIEDPSKEHKTRVDSNPISCKVECEEAVAVEYGPPIAAKAGLCFEYKVKLRSYVNCNMLEKPDLPPTYPICYPSTVCYSIFNYSVTYPQGGPNEDFDACIEKCDGGKYGTSCSQKCYKEVYGNPSKKTLSNSLSFAQKMRRYVNGSQARAGDECHAPNGCYYKDDNGDIIFRGKNPYDYATWYWAVWGVAQYQNAHPGFWCFNNYEGIPRRCHRDENGAFCTDPCEFVGCRGNYYLNDGYAEADYAENLNRYNQVVAKCTAAASCTTSTADFQISVDYSQKEKNGEIKNYTINYPYSSKDGGDGSTLKSPQEKDKNDTACFDSTGKRIDDKNCESTIINYNGCYRDVDQKRWYLTEWSFPGTWISNKSHKISYTKQNGRSWIKAKDKFCLLEDALDVNQYWYNNYYNKLANEGSLVGSYNSDEIKNYCSEYGSQIRNFVKDEEAAKNITYNIKARAKNFGFFHWNIDVQCFYATNSHYSEEYGEGSSYYKDWCNPSPDRYRVRSVDLKNLFPNEEGAYTADEGNTVGRLPGFNWSNYANTTKNDKFISLPFEYAKEVQKLGYSVYSSDYLDYYFKLSPSLLKQIRNSSHVYGLYDGDFVTDENGVVTYRSALFRENGSIINSIKGNKPSENTVAAIPSVEALRCNNMVNVGSDECYVVEISEDEN